MADLSFCSDGDGALLRAAVDAVARGLGEKCRAILLVGPAVPPARHATARPRQLLVVVSDLPVPALTNLAHQTRDSITAGLRLRLLTAGELLRSADVFTLELCEAQARHLLLAGEDPLLDLHFTQDNLRLSLEQALRSLGRQLRQTVLAYVVDGAARRGARPVLSDAIDRMAVIASHALALSGQPGASAEVDLVRQLGELASVDPQPTLDWVGAIRDDGPLDDPVAALADLLLWVEAATRLVDRMGAGD
ncbi:MAG: hypothetical protein JRI23_14700 [Deltaproteobacteria bacterium]|nr:hypothetical protein [Deltaproteobacteria bacterium]MBW2532999.1 hypothetical protein [Deltaproteobacteria bacterium]